MTNEEYIKQNKDKDVRSLALKKMPESVDALWCLRQIEGYQLAKKKLPQWATTDGLWYPPRLSMEQCSSESTALYKKGILDRLRKGLPYSITDITGGFGVDFSYMAQHANRATYIEQQEVLCDIARHNMPLLGIENAEIINGQEFVKQGENAPSSANSECVSFIFADPARRDDAGRKTVAIEDCTPNICNQQDELLENADYLIIKLSPMLDITQALRSLNNVTEVHVVSVKGECKELLFVLAAPHLYNNGSEISYHCANLDSTDDAFSCSDNDIRQGKETIKYAMPTIGFYLFEPNASILKAGVQEAMAQHYGLSKLHPVSNLYVGASKIEGIPARQFCITDLLDFSKNNIKKISKDIKQANLTIRNFPSTVAELRKRLKIKEGGNVYLFATTLHDGSHAIICTK